MDDAASEASSSGLPPPLIRASDYDALVCSACVRQIQALRKIAGTSGALMVVRSTSSPTDPWIVIGKDEAKGTVPVDIDSKDGKVANGVLHEPAAGEKRERSLSVTEDHQAKRARVSPETESASPCLAPSQDPRVRKLLDRLDSSALKVEDAKSESDRYYGAGDVFLTEGWRERWCRCESVRDHVRLAYLH